MRIIRAQHLGMCFGVRDAIDLAVKTAAKEPLTILGELVHNDTVLTSLRSNGIQIETQIENVNTKTAMVTAHGASQQSMDRARKRGLKIIEATCPLVHFAHRAVEQLVKTGSHPIIIGKRDHVEVRGITEDLQDYDVVISIDDIMQLTERSHYGVLAQTTQPIEKVQSLVRCLRNRFPNSNVHLVDTVCQPTKQRQSAAMEVAQESDVVVVIGGSNSNNTHQLVSTCRRFCNHVYHVQNAEELQIEWFYGANTTGLTAGTSTPDSVIDEVEVRLREMCPKDESTPQFESSRIEEMVLDSESNVESANSL